MTDSSQIEKLQEHQKTILLSEIGALIHDIGKLSEEFITEKSECGPSIAAEWHHTRIIDYDEEKGLSKEVNDIDSKEIELRDYIKYHHPKKWDDDFENKYGKSLPLTFKILPATDCFDSEEDKGGKKQQAYGNTFISNAFGKDIKKIDINLLESLRKSCYDNVSEYLKDGEKSLSKLIADDSDNYNEINKRRKTFLKKIKNNFSSTLGETRRASNDVLLWEHTYMSAAIFKALQNQYIFSEEFREELDKIKLDNNELDFSKTDNDYDGIKDIIKENNPFKILSIGWDYFDFLSQSQKISDITGRVKAIDRIKEELRKKIEVEFLLGNRIYEDEKGIHFLIPASFENEEEVREQISDIFNEYVHGILRPKIRYSNEGAFLKEMLPDAIEDLIKVDRSLIREPEWFSINEKKKDKAKNEIKKDKNILICNNCGKGFYIEGNKPEICDTCENKLRDNKTGRTQTKIVDEIAWNGNDYDKLALFNLNFELKQWLDGEYIQSIYFGQVKKESLNKELFGQLKDMINKKIGPKISDNQPIKNLDFNSKVDKFDKYIFKEEELRDDLLSLEREITGEIADSKKQKRASQKLKKILSKYDSWVLNKENPKKPSPSRLMRAWNTTDEFFNNLENEIFSISDDTVERHIFEIEDSFDWSGACEVKFETNEGDEKKGEVFFDDDKIITITPHLNKFIENEKNNLEKIIVREDDWNEKREIKIKDYKSTEEVNNYRIISSSPNQFMILAPSSKTGKIMKRIKEKYEKELGKVYGKLPLNISIVFGKRKTPMFSIVDSARRFRKNHSDEGGEREFEVFDPTEKDNKISLNLKLKNKDDFYYEMEVPYKLGNGDPDFYHPFLKVKDGKDILEVELENAANPITQKHITKIGEGDIIKLDEANFDFEFLDSNKRRFDISVNDKDSRTHDIVGEDGPRPYLFEDWQKFNKLKKIFKTIGSWTPIRDIESITADKRIEWMNEKDEFNDGEKEAYEGFVQDVLENKISETVKDDLEWKGDEFDDKSFLVECIMDGTYFDAVELYKTIMNIDLEDEKDE